MLVKLIVATVFFGAYVAVSLIGMIGGWGIEPANWGWIAFSYVALFLPLFIKFFNEN